MIAVDTNILVYAHRTEAPRHEQALKWLEYLANGQIPWGLPVFCLGEFIRVVTHRRVFDPPSTLEEATGAIQALMESPRIRILSPGSEYFGNLLEALWDGEATGNLVLDAQIVAVCREHGVDTLLTEDRDFKRFSKLRLLNLNDKPS